MMSRLLFNALCVISFALGVLRVLLVLLVLGYALWALILWSLQ